MTERPVTYITYMQGQGNKFFILNGIKQPELSVNPQLARWLAKQRFFGRDHTADQILLLRRAKGGFEYRIWNADGSEVGQCGNGARCAHVFLSWTGYANGPVKLFTQEGVIEVEEADLDDWDLKEDEEPAITRAYLGVPKFEPADIPLARPKKEDLYSLDWQGRQLDFFALSLGNPHAIFEVKDLENAPVAELGKFLNDEAPDFPAGVNVSFVTKPGIHMRVYERGVGETRACGSAAAAVAVAAAVKNKLDQEEYVVSYVTMPGGRLLAGWDGQGTKAWIEGEVEWLGEAVTELPVDLAG